MIPLTLNSLHGSHIGEFPNGLFFVDDIIQQWLEFNRKWLEDSNKFGFLEIFFT
jgi:hypothetical protein